MINPNLNKFVTVTITYTLIPSVVQQYAIYKNVALPVHLHKRTIKPGKRKLYLKYSIMLDKYYLTDMG